MSKILEQIERADKQATAPFSFNNRIVLEAYKTDGSLKPTVKNGFATVEQRSSVKGLKVLVDATVTMGNERVVIPADSIAYIKEELLHTSPWAKNTLECAAIDGRFIIADVQHVEFVVSPNANT